MTEPGRRARKKAEMRSRIAEYAARLFADHGYDDVSVLDVARAADVAEKTVYNYFPTKEHLVLDLDDEEITRLVALLQQRPAGTSPARAIRDDALNVVDSVGEISQDMVRGVVDYLAAVNPSVRRSCLEMTDRHAHLLSEALLEETPGAMDDSYRLRVRAYAGQLAWVYMAIIDEVGRRLVRGLPPTEVATELRPMVAAMLDDLEKTPVPRPRVSRSTGRP